MSRQFSEDELRAIEAEMEKLTVDDVLLQTLVTLINLGARKAGLAAPPGEQEPKRDLEQTHQAIEGARALIPLLEPRHEQELAPVKDALSRLQMAYVQLVRRRREAVRRAGGEGARPRAVLGPPLGAGSVGRPPAVDSPRSTAALPGCRFCFV